MSKLNESIEKNCAELDSRPLLALALLQRGEGDGRRNRTLTKKEVKKAYRSMILKYHPDKNQDCDTSRIFTTIQSAYERLLVETENGTATYTEGEAEPSSTGVGGLHSRSGLRKTQQKQKQQSAAKPKPAAARTPRDEDYFSTNYGRCVFLGIFFFFTYMI